MLKHISNRLLSRGISNNCISAQQCCLLGFRRVQLGSVLHVVGLIKTLPLLRARESNINTCADDQCSAVSVWNNKYTKFKLKFFLLDLGRPKSFTFGKPSLYVWFAVLSVKPADSGSALYIFCSQKKTELLNKLHDKTHSKLNHII